MSNICDIYIKQIEQENLREILEILANQIETLQEKIKEIEHKNSQDLLDKQKY